MLRTFFSSRMEGFPRRLISFSSASGKIRTGFEPVVLARTLNPASRRMAAMSLVTLDFPLVPVMQILSGTLCRFLSKKRRSQMR